MCRQTLELKTRMENSSRMTVPKALVYKKETFNISFKLTFSQCYKDKLIGCIFVFVLLFIKFVVAGSATYPQCFCMTPLGKPFFNRS